MRRAPMIAVVAAGIIFVTLKVLTSKNTLPGINVLQNSGGVADATKSQMVDGLHIALPNNLKYVPVEQLVPLP